eukprot:jgi/Hompol1/6352/HPOL_002032-RA
MTCQLKGRNQEQITQWKSRLEALVVTERQRRKTEAENRTNQAITGMNGMHLDDDEESSEGFGRANSIRSVTTSVTTRSNTNAKQQEAYSPPSTPQSAFFASGASSGFFGQKSAGATPPSDFGQFPGHRRKSSVGSADSGSSAGQTKAAEAKKPAAAPVKSRQAALLALAAMGGGMGGLSAGGGGMGGGMGGGGFFDPSVLRGVPQTKKKKQPAVKEVTEIPSDTKSASSKAPSESGARSIAGGNACSA